jgi:hypothetical protein
MLEDNYDLFGNLGLDTHNLSLISLNNNSSINEIITNNTEKSSVGIIYPSNAEIDASIENLVNKSNTIEPSTVSVVVLDNKGAESLATQGSNTARFNVTRQGDTTSSLTVNYSLTGTADNGNDYNKLSGTVTFAAGSTNTSIYIRPIDDLLWEENETVVLNLLANPNYNLGIDNSATALIVDNEQATISVKVNDGKAAETLVSQTPNPGSFTLTRYGNINNELAVNYTLSGTATNDSDYNSLNGIAIFAPGATTTTVTVNPINDLEIEDTETVILTITEGELYNLDPVNYATITINDNDKPTVNIAISDGNVAETINSEIPNSGKFTLTRTGNIVNSLTVNYTIGGTASNGIDYKELTGNITFAAGSNKTTIDIIALDDFEAESNESLILTITADNNYNLGSSKSAQIFIKDNDLTTITIAASDANTAETTSDLAPNSGQFTLTRSGSVVDSLTVNYQITGTASNGIDIENLTGTVTFAAGANQATIDVNVIDDEIVESIENLVVTLIAGNNYNLGTTNAAAIEIIDNDFIVDWFDLNLQDTNLRSQTRNFAKDSVLDRNDMIALFRDSQDDGIIDGNELNDLRTIINNSTFFGMSDYVEVLSNKVVNSDIANTYYQNTTLGNLFAGTTSTHMEQLIGKWFLGSDRPTTTSSSYTYQYASGSLFQNGISYQDIKQGAVGDCYFLAGLGAVALKSPETITDMFIDNGDNTYTVRFFDYGVADYVTVDRYLPTYGGKFIYANMGNAYNDINNELWVALAEKAYAQMNESGALAQDTTQNSYQAIEGGLGYFSMQHITGEYTDYVYTPSGLIDFNNIVNTFNTSSLVTIGSKASGVDPNVVPNHEYTVIGYNSSTQKLILFNPWGVQGGYYGGTLRSGILELSASQIKTNFDYWAYTV